MKRCKKCGETKPLTDYYKHPQCRDGVRPECKTCFSEAKKAYRAANLETIHELDRVRYLRERDRRIANARKYYAKNREAQLKVRRAHYEANRETYLGYSAKRKAIKRSVERQPYTRREIYDRDGGKCKICGVELPYGLNTFHLDHIVPLDLRGPDTPANLQLTCQPCNRSKWANLEGQIHLPV